MMRYVETCESHDERLDCREIDRGRAAARPRTSIARCYGYVVSLSSDSDLRLLALLSIIRRQSAQLRSRHFE